MRFRILPVLAALVLTSTILPATARADEAPSAASDQKLALARELMSVADVQGAMRRTADAMLDQMSKSFSAMGQSEDAGMTQFMRTLVQDELEALIRKSTPRLAQIYAETFSEQELKDILAFYHTPTGLKMVAKMPELSSRALEVTRLYIPGMQIDVIVKTFDHICDVQHCTADQRKDMVQVEAKIIENIKAQAKAAVEPTT